MPKSNRKSHRTTQNDPDELIRHHLEQASTHLGMVSQLIRAHPDLTLEQREGRSVIVAKIGKGLLHLHRRHGGKQ